MADRERDAETGQFSTEYDDDEFIKAIEQLDGAAPTSEIAKEVGCDRRTAYLRLTELAEANIVGKKKVGNSILWNYD